MQCLTLHRSRSGLFCRDQGRKPPAAHIFKTGKLLWLDLDQWRSNAGIRVCKGFFYSVQKRGNWQDMLFINTFRQIVGFLDAICVQAGVIGFQGFFPAFVCSGA